MVEQRIPPTSRSDGRGRPSVLLVPAAPEGVVVGVDLGHAHVAVAVARTSGTILAEQRHSFDAERDPLGAVDMATDLVKRMLADARLSVPQVVDMAISIPGPVDLNSRLARRSSLPAWGALDMQQELAKRLGRPLLIGHDTEMGAMGELRYGAGRGLGDFIYVKASQGIGAGLVLNGRTYRGAAGIAGEIGHIQLPGATSWCRCGNRGCLESVISVEHVYRQLAQTDIGSASGDPRMSLASLCQNPIAARVITETGRVLGRVLADLCNCLNPAALILGGELGTAGAPLVSGVRESVHRYATFPTAHSVDIRTAELGLRSELMGAISEAIDSATRV